jgi:hypothetical protein
MRGELECTFMADGDDLKHLYGKRPAPYAKMHARSVSSVVGCAIFQGSPSINHIRTTQEKYDHAHLLHSCCRLLYRRSC